MTKVEIYSLTVCPWCVHAKTFLNSKKIPFTEILIDKDIDGGRDKLEKLTGGERTVPQIFIDGKHIGGYDELVALGRDGKLEQMVGHG
ncbi:MAG TPA: glutaredoxin 3 [Alphaproteobacteria bacterium]|jgi:glutaredoxin 3